MWITERNSVGEFVYKCDGYTVFSNSFEWKVEKPSGYVYRKCFKRISDAKKFVENKLMFHVKH